MPIESQEHLDAVVAQPFHARARELLRPLITEAVIDEHRANPLGQHSDELQRLLNYFGSFPIDGKLIVEHDGSDRWFACRLVGAPPLRVERVAGPFESEGAGLDAVFWLRLSEIFDLNLDSV